MPHVSLVNVVLNTIIVQFSQRNGMFLKFSKTTDASKSIYLCKDVANVLQKKLRFESVSKPFIST